MFVFVLHLHVIVSCEITHLLYCYFKDHNTDLVIVSYKKNVKQ